MSPLPLVLDTNVVLDLLVFEDPALGGLARALGSGAASAWADEHTLRELGYVLAYPSFRLDAAAQRAVLARYQGLVHVAPAGPDAALEAALPRCRDRDDQKFLALAARCGARWLVSKDKRVLSMADRAGLPFGILSCRQLLARLPPG